MRFQSVYHLDIKSTSPAPKVFTKKIYYSSTEKIYYSNTFSVLE